MARSQLVATLRWVPVVILILLTLFCYLVYVIDILVPMLTLQPGEVWAPAGREIGDRERGIIYTVVLHVLLFLAELSFIRAVVTDPGQIPESWTLGSDDAKAASFFPQLHTLEVKHDGSVRICRKSKPNMYKPDRAHYCRMLGHCVLRMDHFCPWLNNCVGFHNHKFFHLFLWYTTALTCFMVGSMGKIFVEYVTADVELAAEFRISLTWLILILISLGLVGFLGFHIYLLLNNYTTIEFLEKRGCNPLPDHVNRYDIGYYNNVASIMGNNPLEWPFPTRCSCHGDGLSFRLNPDWYPCPDDPSQQGKSREV